MNQLYSSLLKKYFLLILLLILLTLSGFTQTPVTNIFTSTRSATSSSYTVGTDTYNWGQGNDVYLDSLEISGLYFGIAPDVYQKTIQFKRVDNTISSGDRCQIFVEEGISITDFKGSYPANANGDCSMITALSEPIVNRGALDVFHNIDDGGVEYANNIERLDVLIKGMVAPSVALIDEVGFLATEKNGNNDFKVAAIMSLDANGDPASYGSLITIDGPSDFGMLGSTYSLRLLKNLPNSPHGLPEGFYTSTEQIGYTFISFQDLGLDVGEKIYGISFFGSDVSTASHTLTDPSTFPTNTEEGADIHGGLGSIFHTANISLEDLFDNDVDGIADKNDLDDDNDGIPDLDECNGTFYLDGTHIASNYTSTHFSSLASNIQYNIALKNGITFNTGIGPNLSNFDSGKPSPYNGSQTHLWLEVNTDKNVLDHGTFTITFPGMTVNPTISFSDLSSNTTAPKWSLSLISLNPETSMNLLYTDGDFLIAGDTIRASENSSTNGTGVITFTGIVQELKFKLGHYSESNQDGPVKFAVNIGYTLCPDIDSDGVANMYDLDADNDGIYDVNEAGHSASDAGGDGRIDGVSSLFGTNGLFDALETAADNGILNYSFADSEYTPDGTFDPYDFDSDGDGCFDVFEAGHEDANADGLLGDAPLSVDANGKVTGTGDGYTGTDPIVRNKNIISVSCAKAAAVNPQTRLSVKE